MPSAAAPHRIVVALAAALVLVASAVTAADAPPATNPAAAKKAPAKKAPAKKAAEKPVSAKEAIKEMVSGEDVRDFRTFCDSWMAKLQERNTYNAAHIPWTKGGPGVVGEYITYDTKRTCIAREEPGKDPIGKITYREIKYRKEGPTETAAMGAAGTIVEQTDVTEIFRYAKGRWQY